MLSAALQALKISRALLSLSAAYDPEDREQRRLLAEMLKDRLEKANFKLQPGKRGEDVYIFDHLKVPGMQVKVYTTIQGGAVRHKDADAIRVCLVYHDEAMRRGSPEGRTTGISSECRVLRRGNLNDIVERTIERAREAYKRASEAERCRDCGAPSVLSKAGKRYCAERCWLR